jgi:hypothetical protein
VAVVEAVEVVEAVAAMIKKGTTTAQNQENEEAMAESVPVAPAVKRMTFT